MTCVSIDQSELPAFICPGRYSGTWMSAQGIPSKIAARSGDIAGSARGKA